MLDKNTSSSLHIGMTVLANLPGTSANGYAEIFERHGLVLGLAKNADTNEVEGVYISRMKSDRSNDTGPEYIPLSIEQCKIIGLDCRRYGRLICLDKIELIHPSDVLEELGHIQDNAVLTDIQTYFLSNAPALRIAEKLQKSEQNWVYVQSTSDENQLDDFDLNPVFNQSRVQKYNSNDPYTLALAERSKQMRQQAIELGQVFRQAQSSQPVKKERVQVSSAVLASAARPTSLDDFITPKAVKVKAKGRKGRIDRDRMVAKVNADVRIGLEQQGILKPAPVKIETPVQTQVEPSNRRLKSATQVYQPKPLYTTELTYTPAPPVIAPEPKFERPVIQKSTEPKKSNGDGLADILAAVFSNKSAPLSTYTPIIPQGLKRGDVLITKIYDFTKTDDKSLNNTVRRPVIVWDVFNDADGKVVGIEAVPCTRNLSIYFDHKIEVPSFSNPGRWDGGYAIAEQLLRLPITSQYFPPEQTAKHFYTPDLMQSVENLIQKLDQDGIKRKIFGLPERPDNWIPQTDMDREVTKAVRQKMQKVQSSYEAKQPVWNAGDVKVGDVILAKRLSSAGQSYQALVYGIWYHTGTSNVAALETMEVRNYIPVNDYAPIDVVLDIPNYSDTDAPAFVRASRLDLIPNTSAHFDKELCAPIAKVDAQAMENLSHMRTKALRVTFKREGFVPDVLPFNWVRMDGANQTIPITALKSQYFAPDVAQMRAENVGDLRHFRQQPVRQRFTPR